MLKESMSKEWNNFNMHLAVNLYLRIVDHYRQNCPYVQGKEFHREYIYSRILSFSPGKPINLSLKSTKVGNNKSGKWNLGMAKNYAAKFELDVSGGHQSDYNQGDRDTASASSISSVDLSELL